MGERLYLMAFGPLPCRGNPSVSHAYFKLQPGKLTFAHTLETSTPICTFWWYPRAVRLQMYSQSHLKYLYKNPPHWERKHAMS
ncbi:hypothetical protein DPMN_092590 [Dreissena polymorpha]|uniref:Uncharacterized protein n=1 Tax=Dreissena polymorpha TaxID=45954 RepID=A0A9D4R0B1_DREPO|nr:hypothetical protein DPMN_092590 [Dreissena polymorpha]